jgi:hypothetical protein
MNAFVPDRYDENVQRLALGIEIIDAARLDRAAKPISVAIDGVLLPTGRPPVHRIDVDADGMLLRVSRHDSGLHAVVYTENLYRSGTRESIDLRFLPPLRRFVPRRITFPLVDPATLTPEPLDRTDAELEALRAVRSRQLHLFPGAAYEVGSIATGLRGRVRRGPAPLRWARVEARLPAATGAPPGALLGRAHGDDRGEFFLIIGSPPGPLGTPTFQLAVEVTVFARPADPPTSEFVKQHDPLWDLPLELVTASGPADPVSTGATIPPDYTSSVTQTIAFRLGTILTSDVAPFIF